MSKLLASIITLFALATIALQFTHLPYTLEIQASLALLSLLIGWQASFGWIKQRSITTILASVALIILSAYSAYAYFATRETYFATIVAVIAVLLWRQNALRAEERETETQTVTLPTTARRIVRGAEKEFPIEEVHIDMLLLIKPGDIIPCDGVVAEGSTTVNEHAINGLETPVRKLPSARVYAGTINGEGRIFVRVTALAENTLVRKLEQRMQSSVQTRAPMQQKQERMHKAFVPILIITALATTSIWFIFNWPAAIIHCAAILLIACPYLFSLPVKHGAPEALQRLATRGIRVKDALTLEKLGEINTIVFDKRGILTAGSVRVEHVVSFKPYTQQQVLNLAAAVESHSEHVLSKMIVHFARSNGARSLQKVDDFEEKAGRGVSGTVNSKRVLVGSASFVEQNEVELPQEALGLKEEGHTVVYVVSEKEVLGYIALSDAMRPEAKEVMQALKKYYRIIVLSGDHEDTAAAIARNLGMHEIIADIPPERRAEEIKKLKERGKIVAFVSNGIDDVAARTEAAVTITLGTRAANADDTSITILRPDLSLIAPAFAESRNLMLTAKKQRNTAVWYHVIAIPLAATAGILTGLAWPPLIAALASTTMSISVAKKVSQHD